MWVLSQRKDSWIFHDKTAPEIIEEVFNDHPGLAVRKSMLGKSNYPKLEYCVQYRESDMDFVLRLMEQHGICYHFRHSEGKHELVLGDDSGAWQKLGKRPFYALRGQHRRDEGDRHPDHPERVAAPRRLRVRESLQAQDEQDRGSEIRRGQQLCSHRRNIFSMRCVTRNPPDTLIIARKTAAIPAALPWSCTAQTKTSPASMHATRMIIERERT